MLVVQSWPWPVVMGVAVCLLVVQSWPWPVVMGVAVCLQGRSGVPLIFSSFFCYRWFAPVKSNKL